MIRNLTPADTQAYIDLRRESFRTDPLSFDRDPDSPLDAEEIKKQLASIHDENYVMGYFLEKGEAAGAELVGIWGFERYTRPKRRHRALISGVYVSPRARGRGVAGQLLNECLRRAERMEGLERLVLSMSHRADAARRLYESVGFEVFGREPGAARTGDIAMDEIHMLLNLPAPGSFIH